MVTSGRQDRWLSIENSMLFGIRASLGVPIRCSAAMASTKPAVRPQRSR
jgi:hypothetical protein